MRRAQTGRDATRVRRRMVVWSLEQGSRGRQVALCVGSRCMYGSEPRYAHRGIGQPSLEGATCSINSSRRSVVDLPSMASAEITTTAPPKPSGRMREQVKDDTAETYLSVGERRTMSCKMDSQEVMLRSRSTSCASGSAPCSFNRCSLTRVLATFSADT